MTMNPLPPQAYTKDTLTKAYLWLLHQNESIKELATTPDILVTLFLKAQRNGDDSLDTPSIQNFKNELKSLAGMMGELEKAPSASSSPSSAAAPSAPHSSFASLPGASSQNFRSSTAMPPFSSAGLSSAPMPQQSPQPQFTQPVMPSSAPQPPPKAAPPQAPPSSQQQSSAGNAHSASNESFSQLDSRSRAMIAEVREQLNLGSDVEVLRLFISLGYQKARNLYS